MGKNIRFVPSNFNQDLKAYKFQSEKEKNFTSFIY